MEVPADARRKNVAIKKARALFDAGYYPGAKMLVVKCLFRKSDGKVLGAQVLGEDGVPKRIDSFAMAIQAGFTIYDLEESELSYAPPYGSAGGSAPPRELRPRAGAAAQLVRRDRWLGVGRLRRTRRLVPLLRGPAGERGEGLLRRHRRAGARRVSAAATPAIISSDPPVRIATFITAGRRIVCRAPAAASANMAALRMPSPVKVRT